jgi:hypothetical protein
VGARSIAVSTLKESYLYRSHFRVISQERISVYPNYPYNYFARENFETDRSCCFSHFISVCVRYHLNLNRNNNEEVSAVRKLRRIQNCIRKVDRRYRPPLWSSGQSSWLQIQRFRTRFLALPDFLRSNGSGTGST